MKPIDLRAVFLREMRARFWLILAAIVVAGGMSAAGIPAPKGKSAPGSAGGGRDPLAAEIERWSLSLKSKSSTDEKWTQVKRTGEPVLASAEKALRDGRRLLALQLLANVWTSLAATVYLEGASDTQRKELAGFEAEWTRVGALLRDDLGQPSSTALEGIRPAAVRAVAETALAKLRKYYQSSLEYGRSTEPDSGLYYLGAAQGQRQLVAFCRTLHEPASLAAPPLRALDGEINALEAEVVAAYRPPASIDKHSEFIGVSSTLKEARELDAAGLRYGAQLKYLQAAQQFAPLRPVAPPADRLVERLRELDLRLASAGIDHSLGRLFLESAHSDLASVKPGGSPDLALEIVGDVMPRYLASLEPARPEAAKQVPGVTVTLVRWPYT